MGIVIGQLLGLGLADIGHDDSCNVWSPPTGCVRHVVAVPEEQSSSLNVAYVQGCAEQNTQLPLVRSQRKGGEVHDALQSPRLLICTLLGYSLRAGHDQH